MLSAIYSNRKLNDDGFTLIELLIVVIIIGVLAAIALPIFLNQQKAAVDASVQSDVRNTVSQIVGAQALKLPTVKATVSRDQTKVALTAVPLDSAAGTVAVTQIATSAAPELTNVPATGEAYTVDGWAPDGSKYQGTSDNPSWEFTSTTGKSSQGSGAAPVAGSAGTTGGTGGSTSSNPYYNGEISNSTPFIVNDRSSSTGLELDSYTHDADSNIVGQSLPSDSTVHASNMPIIDGQQGNDPGYYPTYKTSDRTITSFHIYKADGSEVTLGSGTTMQINVGVDSIAFAPSDWGPQYTKGLVMLQIYFQDFADSSLPSAADLHGGKVVATTAEGVNTFLIQ